MPRDWSLREIGNRAFVGMSRVTIQSTDDTKLLQQMKLRGFAGEVMDTIEHAHPYGFTARPKAPSSTGGQNGSAEGFVQFMGGNRSHGVVVVTSDRRYRPNNLQEGEVVNHDDQGQQTYYSRDRIVINAPAGKEVHVQTGDGAHMLATKDKVKIQFGNLSVTIKGGKVLLGSETASHAVSTVDGPSTNVFATISETDTAMQAASTAQRTQAQQQSGQ